ncbi:acyl carrier protein phosphodiesterase [Psychroflexus sediminis]|uniref:Acyl carrier protein phosphodiesterase n=1 Tax=Psychroflexus sediminis TaxID=470826 RepID=A0A1G7VBL7_9FLAO|nr:acyl carrier protein phosphodiesterase [Psychroflexus sediminis]SDG57117.1 Acyl carrier protein phosphodiesterase [Psychroflexus sediminis]
MNYLAHIFLSGDDEFLKLGNFMADEIKGSSYRTYPPEIQKGILLHRAIDDFTDHHPLVSQGAHRFFDELGHYNSVVIDMIYDHILAKRWKEYSDIELPVFAEDFYLLLESNQHLLPKKIGKVVPYMIEHNWLLSYSKLDDLRLILRQMNHKTKHDTQLHKGADIYLAFQSEFDSEFTSFFEDIRKFCNLKIKALNQNI